MHRRFSFHPGLALALALPFGLADAATASIAHLSPSAGEVRIEFGATVAASGLDYREFVDDVAIATGDVAVRALDADGDMIAELVLDVREDDEQLLALVGNGSEIAPYALMRSFDHNFVFAPTAVTLQIANATIHHDLHGEPINVASVLRCGDGARSEKIWRYLDGFSANVNLETHEPATHCRVTATIGESQFATTFSTTANERIRLVFAGDGDVAPFEALVLRQGFTPPLPQMAANVSINGLWIAPAISAEGVSLAYVPDGQSGEVRGIHYGYDPSGDAMWTVFDGDIQYRYIGGSLDDVQPTIRYLENDYHLQFHSCREATLMVAAGPGSPVFDTRPAPRNSIRLYKLLPLDACDTETAP